MKFLVIFLMLFFIGCFESESDPNCPDGETFNPDVNRCIHDICKNPQRIMDYEQGESSLYCENGCYYKENQLNVTIDCYKTDPYIED